MYLSTADAVQHNAMLLAHQQLTVNVVTMELLSHKTTYETTKSTKRFLSLASWHLYWDSCCEPLQRDVLSIA